MCFSPYLGVGGGGGGAAPKGSRAHNLLMQFSRLSSSKMEFSETDFFDNLTIQNDQISFVKHVLAPRYVFFTLFGCWGGGGAPKGYRASSGAANCCERLPLTGHALSSRWPVPFDRGSGHAPTLRPRRKRRYKCHTWHPIARTCGSSGAQARLRAPVRIQPAVGERFLMGDFPCHLAARVDGGIDQYSVQG